LNKTKATGFFYDTPTQYFTKHFKATIDPGRKKFGIGNSEMFGLQNGKQ
jgi:hypothetical protein